MGSNIMNNILIFFYSDKLSIYYNEAIGYNYIHVGTEREALE